MSKDDIFRPRKDPARSIYDAFQAEAAKRQGRPLEAWAENEIQAVWRAARDQAQQLGLRIPTIDEVRSTEQYARGSVDYGAKWAHCLVNRMREVR